jgi:hypothetical protein
MMIGEIIETSSTGFVAESFELNHPPALGRFVVVHSPVSGAASFIELYAIVTNGRTVGMDPSRRPVRQSTAAVYDQAVYEHQPQLKHTLRTEFAAAMVGWSADGRSWQRLPSRPPPLHFSVHTASEEQVRQFTDSFQYLRLLLQTCAEVSPFQVMAASVRETFQQRGQDHDWLRQAAREIAVLLKSDHEALLNVLQAIDPGAPDVADLAPTRRRSAGGLDSSRRGARP